MTAYPTKICVHQLFEAQVERTPDAVAVISEDHRLTYGELNRRANQLAHHLQESGVGPETLVGIYVERSLEMVVGLLGILKAGGAYVALDPTYPQQRLAFILSDAQPSLLLGKQQLVEELPNHELPFVCLDTDQGVSAQEGENNPMNEVTASNLACVFYTSGTTGRPKGVMVEHGSVVNYTRFASDEYAIASHDRVLQFASISYDASAEEIYPTLAQGATLVLRTEEMLDSAYGFHGSVFLKRCKHWALTVASLPTSAWHELVKQLDAEEVEIPPSLRLMIIGGERVLPERLAVWQKRVSQRVTLLNTYGPTETTVVATACTLTPSAQAEPTLREVPIGRPIANAEVYILDESLQPVPMGTPGELHIGGAGLARGYLNRPELTEEKFIRNPFSDEPGARLYKSGDLARYRPDGNVEFLGRLDRQVKILGFRVELEEIESVLDQHTAVQQSTVVMREDVPGEKYLMAYLVPEPKLLKPALSGSELRGFLEERLPRYMVPSAFAMLETLITASGEIQTLELKEL
jgi:amino acid adenylation domain-containing protein